MKTAVISGASSGMGREFAKLAFPQFDRVYLIARRKEKLLDVCCGHKNAIPISMDVSDREKTDDFFDTLKCMNISVDLLVCCAGFGLSGDIINMPPDTACNMIRVNFEALAYMTLKALPLMKRGSHIIHLNSAAAFSPQPGFALYAASKAGAHSFSEALGAELKKSGITVTSVCPGPVKTAFFDTAGPVTSPVKKLFMVHPECVAKKALRDAKRGRMISVYGPAMKISRFFSGLLPERLIVNIMNFLRKEG